MVEVVRAHALKGKKKSPPHFLVYLSWHEVYQIVAVDGQVKKYRVIR
jgi:hypothetical protein